MKRLWEPEELVEHWSLIADELALVGNKTGATRLGFSVMLKAFLYEGTFPTGTHDVPLPVVAFLARQVGVPVDAYREYDWHGRASKYHRAQIRAYRGVGAATVADAEAVAAWLVEHVLDHQHQPEALRAAATERFRSLRLEPPTHKRMHRLVRTALHAYETRLFAATLARRAPATVTALEALVSTHPTAAVNTDTTDAAVAPETSPFATLRADPGGVIGPRRLLPFIAKLVQGSVLRHNGVAADEPLPRGEGMKGTMALAGAGTGVVEQHLAVDFVDD